MTSAVTVEEERGQEQEAQPPAFEGEDIEAVRAHMLRLLTEGHGEQAIEMLLGLLGRLREEHSSMAVRLKEALRQLYGRRSEKTPASQLQLLLSFLTQQQSAEPAAVPATADGAQAAAAAPPADAPKKPPDWSGKGPQGVLADFRGYLVVDGYKGYEALFGSDSPRIEVGCWMHARRGFERAYVAGDARGGVVLTLVQKLYAVERQAQDAGLSPEARLTLRLSHSLPVYEELFGLLEEWAPHVPAKTPLGKAIAYARNRAVPLGRFLTDGRLPVDNGDVERLIKLIVLGRKNWLFLGSDAAGHRAANVYSLVLSCYRLGMDPWAYFRDVLPKLGDTRFPASRLAELLPESWAQQQAQQR